MNENFLIKKIRTYSLVSLLIPLLTLNFCYFAYYILGNINIYPNPSSYKIYITKNVDFNVYNMIGDIIISGINKNVLDVSYLIPGIYNLQIIYNENIINKKIIKK